MKHIITKEEKDNIDSTCSKYRIKNYTINQDGSIDVDGDVDLASRVLTELPLKFNKVSGNFFCNNNRLTTLIGCPNIVSGNFYCTYNHLESLVGCPSEVGGKFNCYNNQLTSLIGCPIIIRGDFLCSSNELKSLNGCPSEVGADFNCTSNELTSLAGCPNQVGGSFLCFKNNLHPFYDIAIKELNNDIGIFVKYMDQYDVWTYGYNKKNAMELIDEIKDGLR